MSDKFLFTAGQDWTPEILERAWEEIEVIAKEELRLTYYKPQIEIVTAKQMLDAYTSVGMPMYYKHWSFGKEFVQIERAYKKGEMGLAYELVINSDPCIAYLMEENDALVQTLVMAHASVGHAAVFTHNYMFTEATDATAIIDYLAFAKNYIKMCEEKHGFNEVEAVIDACHSLQNYGVDKYKRSPKLSAVKEEIKAMERFDRELEEYDVVWEKIGKQQTVVAKKGMRGLGIEVTPDPGQLVEPQENILYFIEKNAPHLPAWKRELIRIVRKLAQYFSPQRGTKVLNEGFASFCHYYIVNRLWDKGFLDGGSMVEFFATHGNVILQQKFQSLNPYKLGFSIFMDIKRMCEAPTDEDREYFPDLVGKDWVEEITYAMKNFKDETFILQYLSPKVARDLQLFIINSESGFAENYEVTEICNERSFRDLRSKLAASYAMENLIPDIQITAVDYKKTRKITLKHDVQSGKPLHIENTKKVLQHVADLWEYSAALETIEYGAGGTAAPITLHVAGKYSNAPKFGEN